MFYSHPESRLRSCEGERIAQPIHGDIACVSQDSLSNGLLIDLLSVSGSQTQLSIPRSVATGFFNSIIIRLEQGEGAAKDDFAENIGALQLEAMASMVYMRGGPSGHRSVSIKRQHRVVGVKLAGDERAWLVEFFGHENASGLRRVAWIRVDKTRLQRLCGMMAIVMIYARWCFNFPHWLVSSMIARIESDLLVCDLSVRLRRGGGGGRDQQI